LSISKQLVELMDGSIKLVSKLQEGTRVSISIPAVQMDQNTVEETSPQSASALLSISKPVNILIVEDHQINQAVIVALFEKLGLAFTIVDTGEEGVEYIKSNHADLVLMDINLPGIQGDQASRLIKAQYPDLPIVALTADAITTSDNLKERGLDDVLTKPINTANLVKVLNHYLG
jgi:CheY-like chemotaxis protein